MFVRLSSSVSVPLLYVANGMVRGMKRDEHCPWPLSKMSLDVHWHAFDCNAPWHFWCIPKCAHIFRLTTTKRQRARTTENEWIYINLYLFLETKNMYHDVRALPRICFVCCTLNIYIIYIRVYTDESYVSIGFDTPANLSIAIRKASIFTYCLGN